MTARIIPHPTVPTTILYAVETHVGGQTAHSVLSQSELARSLPGAFRHVVTGATRITQRLGRVSITVSVIEQEPGQ